MKLKFKNILGLAICVFHATYSSPHAMDDNTTWSQAYTLFREHFDKSLSTSEITHCDKLLNEILNDLDVKNQCDDNNDCILIDQQPFGSVVPYPKIIATRMKIKMIDYYALCDDGSFHSSKYEDLVNTPVCKVGKCMVKTNSRKKNSQ